MKKQGWILIGITAAFFCLLIGVYIGRNANKSYINIQDIQDTSTQSTQVQLPVTSTKININTATTEELQLLDGIGETMAQRIIDYRNTHGNFESIDELMNVTGIGEKRFNNIKDFITVD